MQLPVGVLINGIDMFLLVFIRITGLFVVAPIFGRRNIPVYMKIGFSFLLALVMINVVTVQGQYYQQNIYRFAYLTVKEFIVGVTIGYVEIGRAHV